tara:strand:- start:20732 stop:22549 length:1818 start_codon:yes stop_codon:yes gene_type:complete
MSKTYQEKLGKLRQLMAKNNVDVYLVPRADEYLGEFVAAYAERLSYISGFTGSAGQAIILSDRAIVQSDGRYTIQLQDQLDPNLFVAGNSVSEPLKDWLHDNVASGQVVGYDPRLYSVQAVRDIEIRLAAKDITLRAVEENLIDAIWDDQPAPPQNACYLFHEGMSGQTRHDKLTQICAEIKESGVQAAFITKPDSIAWLLNVRGSDLDYMPVVLSVVIVDADQGIAHWFVDYAKVPEDVRTALSPHVKIHTPESLESVIALMGAADFSVDPCNTPYYYAALLRAHQIAMVDAKDPCIEAKARKNALEQAAIKKAHVLDGAAIVKTLAWIDRLNASGDLTKQSEMDVAEKLHSYRSENPAYKGESFPAITGAGSNGAIVHYRATPSTNRALTGDTLLLIDSGGQYYDVDQHCAGTTDITRTVAIGNPDKIDHAAKQSFTRVLQGHIALASAQFKAGATGADLDVYARGALQSAGQDYAHGTGHGVGCFGDVHEEAAHISPRGKAALEVGMLLSNEPGYYETGEYGIRTENLIFVCEARHGFENDLCFETITLAPIDLRLVDVTLLSEPEITWLNAYHQAVFDTLSPLLSGDDLVWLQHNTQDLVK